MSITNMISKVNLVMKNQPITSQNVSALNEMLNLIMNQMNYKFKANPDLPKSIIIDTQIGNPLCDNNNGVIYIHADAIHWAQVAYQFCHEYCHWIINSPYPGQKYLWLEESICELSSRYFTRKIAYAHVNNKDLKGFKLQFVSYVNALDDGAVWDFGEETRNEPNFLVYEATAQERPHFDYLATKLAPIISDNNWPVTKQLSKFSNALSLTENIDVEVRPISVQVADSLISLFR